MTFTHAAYGLRIHSDINLVELEPAEPDACEPSIDVWVRWTILREIDLDTCPQIVPNVWANRDCLRLNIPDVATFLIRNGQEILIEPVAGIDEDSVRVFLLGSAFGALLMQRGFLVLHGNAVRVRDQAMICCGDSGVGKSTLAAGFMQRGFDVLADDVVPVSSKGFAIPGLGRIKLWREVAERLGIDTRDLRQISPNIDKLHLPLSRPDGAGPVKVGWIYALNVGPVDRVTVEPLCGVERFQPLHDNTYRLPFVEGMSLKQEHLAQCGKLASQVRIARVTRPETGFDLDALVDRLLEDMAEYP